MTAQEVLLRMKYNIPLHADIKNLSVLDIPMELVRCIIDDDFDQLRRETKLKQRKA